ncbi:outer membrane receptor protein involved in Fe transport [Gillisia mitskevichiae]|uniref:Outer membrane receptor protein involved in Fe transport n=1 Tax=Gillisia mitskevichiae TaxID=270921 RepID=A0A495PJ06_9FLAO|nr:outer membrane beta-barrel protein [Gillisia mitskevichiae]RKS50623.1 outer membrane receptor protein involved in Fe transport [Gillisia mitskevichiae]
MFNRFLVALVFSTISLISYSQEFSVSGKLIDRDSKLPLEAATVFVESVKDSSLITYTISDKFGVFELKGSTQASKVNLYISFVGYKPYEKLIAIEENRNLKLEAISLSEQIESLGDVVIQGRRAPISIKKDTLEFNVASFKTKKDANVEDLLKELPGVEVDEQGNITVNGKPVNKILVNGKPFFGNDPTIATRNLTKEIVDKIQVTDTKTDSEAFNNEAGDDQNKTINITIDEEKNKGIFGRVAAGGGTDERFEYAGLLNYFDNDLRISALSGGNNINSPGFSFGEIQKMFGNVNYMSISSNGTLNFGGRVFGGGEGITNSRTAGVNYADDIGEKVEISSDYFYSASNSYEDKIRNRENILPERRYFSNLVSNSNSNSDNHAININLKTKIDSTFLIEFKPKFNYTNGDSRYQSSEETLNMEEELTNSSSTNNQAIREGKNFKGDLSLNKRYGSNGGFVKLSIENELNDTDNDNFSQSETLIFGDTPQEILRDQFTDGNQQTNAIEINTNVRVPLLAKKLFMDVEYGFKNQDKDDAQLVYDLDQNLDTYSILNVDQSTDFTNVDRTSRPEIGITYDVDKVRIRLNTGYVFRTLKSDDALRAINFTNDFNAIEFSGNIRYKFSEKTSLYTGFGISNNVPGIRQLSPYIDVSDPLNIVQGNPDLKPAKSHYLYLNLNNYDFQTRTGMYTYININVDNDKVVSRSIIDPSFIRTTTYDNVDGYYQIYANTNYSKNIALDSLRTLNLDVGIGLNASRNVNFNNDVKYASRNFSYSPKLGFRFIWKELFEFRPNYELSYTSNNFDIDNFEDRNFVRHELRLRTITFYPKKLEWNNDIKYNINPDVAPGFETSSVFWNSSLAYSVLKDQGTITFKVYDLLNQNTNSQRTATQDYIQDMESTVLERYFMLGFSYKFNTLGKKGETRKSNFWFD